MPNSANFRVLLNFFQAKISSLEKLCGGSVVLVPITRDQSGLAKIGSCCVRCWALKKSPLRIFRFTDDVV